MKKVIKSLFISAALATAAIAGQSEKFGGLGISVWTGKQGVKIAGVIPNSPAESAGLQAGDLIVAANGTQLSTVEPKMQVSYLRGESGSSISLLVERNGEVFSVSTKRIDLSIQNMDAEDISKWYGKDNGLTAEEINYLADQKTEDGYKTLGVMKYGMPILDEAENLNANGIQQISVKEEAKAEEKVQEPVQLAPEANYTARKTVNAKGAKANNGFTPKYRLLRQHR